MKTCLLVVCSLWLGITTAFSQVLPDRFHHHFGVLTAEDERFTDFVLTNRSAARIFILRTDADKDVRILFSNRTLLPDSSVTMRVQYNPSEKGRFSRQLSVYVSALDEPLTFSLSGETAQLPAGMSPECPDFSAVASVARVPEFELRAKAVDAYTGEALSQVKIRLIHKGLPVHQLTTTREGAVRTRIPLGYYYVVATRPGYRPVERDVYLHVRRDTLLLAMIPLLPEPVAEERPMPDSLFFPSLPETANEIPVSADTLVVQEEIGPLQEDADTASFSERLYVRNNLVFLIDVSSSMLEEGKLDLLKASMIKVAEMLRSVDRISIVAYSTQARVILPSVSGDQKEKVIGIIRDAEASGLTAGGEGMKLAYQVAMQHFVEGGNNLVIMATDGAFNLYTSDVMPLVKRFRKRGIHTSVIGIRNTEADEKSMKKIAETGEGRYLPITNFQQAEHSLTEEIRAASKKR